MATLVSSIGSWMWRSQCVVDWW